MWGDSQECYQLHSLWCLSSGLGVSGSECVKECVCAGKELPGMHCYVLRATGPRSLCAVWVACRVGLCLCCCENYNF